MKHVSLTEAKADIGQVFDEVARGNAVTINPDQPVETEADRVARTNRAIDAILELRKHVKPASIDEIIAWKNEGRK